VVKQRLKLAAVSPKLIGLYRDGEMSLEELTAFTVTDDHPKQERVWEELPNYQRDRRSILHALREGQVSADDRRAVFAETMGQLQPRGANSTQSRFDPCARRVHRLCDHP
jgi:ParB family chromosome partitioning protein